MNRRILALISAAAVLGLSLTVSWTIEEEPAAAAPERPTQERVAWRPAAPIEQAPAAAIAGQQAAYIDGQVMLTVAAGDRLEDVATDHAATIARALGPAGLGVLQAAPGVSTGDLLARLRADPRVRTAGPHGRIIGASDPHSDGPELDWHLDLAGAPSRDDDLSGYVVAVLDSGVADVPSLASSAVVDPWDFVNQDDDPDDDHQHGTHIAGIIAADGGDVQGVAPGVSLMPLKVLDHENSGYEVDLVDAIYHAVDSGADVINMSLAFGYDYAPSAALTDALRVAAAAGVVLIAASGNAGADEVSWPASSPDVIAVGATCADGEQADYSNVGGAMDVMAPGGCIDQDYNGDGILDGIVAESINPADGSVGLWAMAGTSQAAAVVSGAVVHALDAGAEPHEVAELLQLAARGEGGGRSFSAGNGAGMLDIEHATRRADSVGANPWGEYHLAVLPFLEDNGDGTVTPAAQLTVLNAELRVASRLTALAQFHGSTSAAASCELRGRSTEGRCIVRGPSIAADEAQAWRITADAVVRTRQIAYRPRVLMFGTGMLDRIAAAQLDDAELREAMLALHWAAGDEPELGLLAESYAVIDSGAGLTTNPTAMLLTPASLEGVAGEDRSMDGTGLAISPIGMRWMQLDGSGLSASPIMMLALSAFDGEARSPIVNSYTRIDGSGLSTSPLLMSDGEVEGVRPLDSLQRLMDSGGWSTPDGEQAASLLNTSGAFETQADTLGAGASLGSIALD